MEIFDYSDSDAWQNEIGIENFKEDKFSTKKFKYEYKHKNNYRRG